MQTVCVIKKGWQIHWVFIYHHLCLVIPFLKKKSSRLKQICRRGEDVYRSHFTRKEKERRRERERTVLIMYNNNRYFSLYVTRIG